MEKSLKKHIYELLEESGRALSIEEIIHGLSKRLITKSKQQVRNALNNYSCMEIIRIDRGKYDLLTRVVNGSYYRYTLTDEDINDGMLPCDRELLFIFDPYTSYKNRNVRFYAGGSLLLELELKFCGPDALPRRKIAGLDGFYENNGLEPGDDLVINSVDIDKGNYGLIPLKKGKRNEEVIFKKNKDIADMAGYILNRINGQFCWTHELLRRIFAGYSFKDPVPPDHLSNILRNDKRFLMKDTSAGRKNQRSMDEVLIADSVRLDEHNAPVLKSFAGSWRKSNSKKTSHRRSKIKKDFIKVYQFKITLNDIEPLIWRRIQVPETYTFWDLHVAIQDSMGWLDSHLHEFHIKSPGSRKAVVMGIYREGDIEDRDILMDWEVKLAYYFTFENRMAKYVYDFGDDWEHTIELEGILIREKNKEYPACLDGARACPPEDVGSTGGYENFLKIISNPGHEEYEETLEWACSQLDMKDEMKSCRVENRHRKFDPEHFDPKEVEFDDPSERLKNITGY